MLNRVQLFNFVVCALSIASTTRAVTIGPVGNLNIANGNVSPDGFTRAAVLAGGTFPGPVIRASKGARYQLNVVNNLDDDTMETETSIHWHGIFQRGSSWADGTASVTQCPIVPNNAFKYDFQSPDQAGTFWYHSHLSTQYCDGLRGAFIIDDPFDPFRFILYDIDDESTIITLADWYHQPAKSLIEGIGHPAPPPVAASTLINGRGRDSTNPTAPLSVINVVAKKRYRFRIIGMSCDPAFKFSIDKHTFTIIEADGEYTSPLLVDSLDVYPGQRYSVVMTASQSVGNYWIRANPDRGITGFENGINTAILRYAGAPTADPTAALTPAPVSKLPFKESNLHAWDNPFAPGWPWQGGADVNINIKHDFNFEKFQYEMNGAPFVPPTMPVLLQILSRTQAAQDLLPSGSIYELPPNKVIEISLPGSGVEIGGPHPFHLHGHAFSVVRSGDSPNYNYFNPVRRDTVNTGLAGDNATIRFVTDNAGPWFLHCHIDWHLELGLAVVFAENIPGIKAPSSKPPPQAWRDLCPA